MNRQSRFPGWSSFSRSVPDIIPRGVRKRFRVRTAPSHGRRCARLAGPRGQPMSPFQPPRPLDRSRHLQPFIGTEIRRDMAALRQVVAKEQLAQIFPNASCRADAWRRRSRPSGRWRYRRDASGKPRQTGVKRAIGLICFVPRFPRRFGWRLRARFDNRGAATVQRTTLQHELILFRQYLGLHRMGLACFVGLMFVPSDSI